MQEKKSSYHHGDLRAKLVKAGVALIHQYGPDALSIRKTAASAGVSHAAPAHHFPSLTHLRTAVVAHGFRQFSVMMQHEVDLVSSGDPRDILLAAGRGYLGFAVQNAALYHLMFGGSEVFREDPELQSASQTSYDVLRFIAAPLAPGEAGEIGNELLVWSLMHGFAGLVINDRSGRLSAENALPLLEAIFPDLPMRK